MIILGILFLAGAAVVTVELILANRGIHNQVNFHMWRWTWHFDAFWLAVGGAAILVVAVMGLAMLKAGGARARRLRRERRELAAENRRLAERSVGGAGSSSAPYDHGPVEGSAQSGESSGGSDVPVHPDGVPVSEPAQSRRLEP